MSGLVENNGRATNAGGGDLLPERLATYLGRELGRPISVSDLQRFPVGFSWQTFGFLIDAPGIDGVTRLILRLGPPNGLFAPYSAAPQYLALKALAGHGVPAPRTFLWSDDPTLLGAVFFISEWISGTAPIPWGAELGFGDDRRIALANQFVDALGNLHNIDWPGTGLSAFGAPPTPESAASGQIDVWEAAYRRWKLRPYPMMNLAFQWLRGHCPVAPRVSMIHGDFRLGNFLEVDGLITAVLDWELVHIGDPHEDLAWFCLPQYRGGSNLMCRLISREDLYRRYEARTGIAVDDRSMRFYEVFSLVKLAATHMAAVASFQRGGFHDMRMPAMGTQIAPVLRQIEKTLEAAA